MSQAPAITSTPTAGRTSATIRAIVFVALLTGNLFPSLGPVSLATAAAILAAPMVVWEIVRALPKIHPALPVTALVFVVLIVPGLLNPPILPYGEEKLGKILTSLLLSALAATLIRDRRHIRVLAWVWLTAACVLALATIAAGGEARATTFDSNPIWLGRELVSGLLVAVWLSWRKLLHPLVALSLIVLILSALSETESRGPLLGAVAALVLFVAVVRPMLSGLGWAAASFVSATVIAVFYFAPQIIPDRFLALVLAPGETVDSTSRTEMWVKTLAMIESNPGGVGYGNWQTYTNMRHLWPHNLFLEVFAEAGWLPGAVITLTTLGVLVALARRSRRDPEAAMVLILLVASVVEVSASGDLNARTFFALLVLGAVVATWRREEQDDSPAPAIEHRATARV